MFEHNINDDESTLIVGLIKGEQQAFEAFVRMHRGWMLALALRLLKNDPIAEDCVQESFIKAIQSIASYEGRAPFSAWLRRIVINSCLAKLRQGQHRNEVNIDDLMPEFDQYNCRIEASWRMVDSPDALLQKSENIKEILYYINLLPTNYCVVLLLRDIEELNTQEVADILECSVGTVKVRLHRARCALKKLLEPMMREARRS